MPHYNVDSELKKIYKQFRKTKNLTIKDEMDKFMDLYNNYMIDKWICDDTGCAYTDPCELCNEYIKYKRLVPDEMERLDYYYYKKDYNREKKERGKDWTIQKHIKYLEENKEMIGVFKRNGM